MGVYYNGQPSTGGVSDAELTAALALKADIFRDGIDGIAEANEDRRKSIRLDESGNEYIVEPYFNPATDADGTWSRYTNSNFEGSYGAYPYLRGASGQFFYSTSHHHFYRSSPAGELVEWLQVSFETALGSNIHWLGEFDSEADAVNAIDSFDSSMAYYTFVPRLGVRVLDNASYTAPAGPNTSYIWSRIASNEAERISNLENQVLKRHIYDFDEFELEGNASKTVTVDLTSIRAFLTDSRAFASIRLSFTAQASVYPGAGQYNIQLGTTGNLLNTSGGIGSTNEFTINFNPIIRNTLSENMVPLRISVSNATASGASVVFSNVSLSITNGFNPSAQQVRDILGVTEAQLNNMFVGASVTSTTAGNVITYTQADGTTETITVEDRGTEISVQSTAPTSPHEHDLWLLDVDISTLTNAVDTDGTTAKTSGVASDLFRYNGTNWQYVGFIGDTTLTAPEIRSLLGISASDFNNLFTGVSIADNVITYTQVDGSTETVTLPSHESTDIGVGNTLPADPATGDLYLFEEDTTGLTNVVESDGTTAKTSVQRLDLVRYNGTNWRYIGFIGNTNTGAADGVLTGATLERRTLTLTRS